MSLWQRLGVSLGRWLGVRASATNEGASTSRRTLGWHAPTAGPNDSMLGDLTLLRDRSRQATRNDGYARGAVERLTANVVGTGIVPLSRADDPDFQKLAQDLWLLWTDESDADGQLDWYGQQEQSVRCWMEAGECFLRLRSRLPGDGLRVPLQLQVLEPELCPHAYTTTGPNGNKIRAGIEFDAIGRRVAYYFFAQRPGDFSDWNASDLRRIPAEQVLHLYRPLRPSQIRGIPHLSPALIRLRELDQFDDATLVRQKLANMFVAFLNRGSDGDSSIDFLTGQARESADDGDRPPLGLEPGLFQELSPGETVTFSDPPDVIQGYGEYMRAQLMGACAGIGVPYEVLTGDMSRVNDRTVRVILGEFRRWVQQLQHHQLAFQVCRPIWRAWMDRAVVSGALLVPPAQYRADPLPWVRVQWQPQGWPYLHPVQDIEAQQAAIRAGLSSRQAAVAEQGLSAEIIDEQQAEDNARADRLGLAYDSDARRPKAAANPKPPSSEEPDPESGAPAPAAPPPSGGKPGPASNSRPAPPAREAA